MKNIIKVFVLSLALVSTSGYGATVMGSGTVSCGTWTKDREDNLYLTKNSESWLVGYLSGVNMWVVSDKDFLKDEDSNGLFAWLDNYCKVNPLKEMYQAANALVGELMK